MPPLADRLALADLTMRALGVDAELPPKIGVHPRQPGSLAHAMPALLRGDSSDGSDDLLGAKWIAGFPANPASGLPAYSALVLLNDPLTGQPIAVMDAAAITAQRTAAISGVAIRAVLEARPSLREQAEIRIAILGAGVQARAHLPVIGTLLPRAEVAVMDADGARAESCVEEARAVEGIRGATVVGSVREAVDRADVVVSVVSFGPDRQSMDPAWLTADAVTVAVDYDMQAPAALAREAFFAVDDRTQFLSTRDETTFAGYPDPAFTIGDLLSGRALPPDTGRVLVAHLGVGLADVVFAAAVLARAEQLGIGRILPR